MFILDPFGGTKPRLAGRGKEALLQGQPSAFGPIQGRRVEGLTLPIFHEGFLLTPGIFPENEEISAPAPFGF